MDEPDIRVTFGEHFTVWPFLQSFYRVSTVTGSDGADMETKKTEVLEEVLERELTLRYGPLVSGASLQQVLGYASSDAFRQALSRKTVPIPVFSIQNRRGKFALVKDVAAWLATQRDAAVRQIEPSSTDMAGG